ncbi:MAG: asparagine synthase C-terminal domain-containing protein, partial [Clostridia bacterium]|nr:asparagine synthase C-terminal domain-containing protein [Clostridia bacterium]
KQVKVCLSGEGADEFFGGYNVYKEPFALAWFDKLPACLRRGLGKVAEKFPRMKGANFLLRRAKPLEERYIGNTNLMSESFKKQLLLRYDGKTKPTDLTKSYRHKLEGMDAVTKMQYIDLHTWLMGDILLKADKMSMASSLELRVPFLDREVFALASRIPTKYRANKDGTKLAMRKAAAKHIPAGVASKKKLGFPVPVRAWLREETYASLVREQFASAHAAKFFRTEALLSLLEEHVAEKKDNWRQIWCVFVFLVWYEEYFVKR